MSSSYFTAYSTAYGTPYRPGSGSVVTLPYDLAAAVVALFGASPALSGEGMFSRIYRDQAGDRPVLPYLVYSVKRGSLAYKTSDSAWHDDRVTFKAWAATGEQANDLADAVRGVFEPGGAGVNLSFQTGVTAPLYETDRAQGKGSGRGKNATYRFWSMVEYSARNRDGRPS